MSFRLVHAARCLVGSAILVIGLASCGGGAIGPSAVSLKDLLSTATPVLPVEGVCRQKQPAPADIDALVSGYVAATTVDCEPSSPGGPQDLQAITFLEFAGAETARAAVTSLANRVLGEPDGERDATNVIERQELKEDLPDGSMCFGTAERTNAACALVAGKYLVLIQGETSSCADLAAPQRAARALYEWMDER